MVPRLVDVCCNVRISKVDVGGGNLRSGKTTLSCDAVDNEHSKVILGRQSQVVYLNTVLVCKTHIHIVEYV